MDVPHAPTASNHVQLQWWSRNPNRSIDIQTAWRLGVPIGAPDYHYDNARLHAPSGIIILSRNNRLVTVIYGEDIRTEDSHLKTCDHCGQRYDPKREDGDCHWCSEPDQAIMSAAQPAMA